MTKEPKIYLVGGAVRDKLMGLKSKDNDYVVECDSFDAMRQLILDKGGKIFLETPKYFTIRALVPELGSADYVLARKDGAYTDGRRPDEVIIGTIYDDLARRDFTVNAIAIEVDTGKVLDPHDGQHDLKQRVLRCVGNADTRMNEDYLRAYRAIRFSITKHLTIDDDLSIVLSLLRDSRFSHISTERIREEMLKMFAYSTKEAMRALFVDYPVLGDVALARGLWLEPTTRKV